VVQLIKGVFFDIDDTLYDSTKLARMARENSIKAMIDAGLDVAGEEELYSRLNAIIRKFGSNYARHYDELLKDYGVKWNPRIIAAGVVAYERTKAGYLRPYPGTIPTLIKLKKGHSLGVISNGLAVKQWEKLVGLGIHHFFDVVATSEELGHSKPSTRIFEYAMGEVGLDPSECVMVGDRLDTDILGGNRAGMTTVLMRTVREQEPAGDEDRPDYEIRSLCELPPLLEGLQ
jgi:putative hydrolase of the HAD superfamily